MLKLILLAFSLLFVATAVNAEESLRVGAVLPLTGEVSIPGTEIQNGMTLAIEELKDDGIKLFFEDSQFDMRQTASATKKLIESDKVDVVVSLWDTSDAAAPITERAGVIHVAIRWDPAITKDRPLTFTLEPTYQSWADQALKQLQEHKIDSLYFIGQETKSTQQAMSYMREHSDRCGIRWVGDDTFLASEADYRSLLLRAARKKPALIFVFAYPPANDRAISQLRQVLPGQKFGGILELVKDLSLVEGIPNVSIYKSDEHFNSMYQSRYKQGFQTRAPHGYILIKLLADLKSKLSGKMSKAKELASILSNLKGYPSALGPLSVNKDRNIEHPTSQSIVHDGIRRYDIEALKSSVW